MKHQKYFLLIFLFLALNLSASEQDEAKQLLGDYACTFTQGDYTYDPFRCVIKKVDGRLQLEKLSGSQRIKGEIHLTEEGFTFEGIFFCPWGDCDSTASGEFTKISEGKYQGPVMTGEIETIITLTKKN